MASLGPNRITIVLSQGISIMKSSKNGEDLYIMVNYARRHSRRRLRQSRHAESMQDQPSFMEFPGKEIQK